jgi:hypothetical protein
MYIMFSTYSPDFLKHRSKVHTSLHSFTITCTESSTSHFSFQRQACESSFFFEFHVCGSVDHNLHAWKKVRQDATLVSWIYCKTTLHSSGTFRTHHQEYNKLEFTATGAKYVPIVISVVGKIRWNVSTIGGGGAGHFTVK